MYRGMRSAARCRRLPQGIAGFERVPRRRMRGPFAVSTSGHAVVPRLILICWLAVASCDSDVPRASNQSAPPSPDSDSAAPSEPAASSPDTVPLGAHSAEELVDAATAVVAFLRGEAGFDRIRVADTVTLYLAPEAGGAPRTVTRAMLRDPSNWTIRGPGLRPGRQGIPYSFVPSKGAAELTMRVGRHMNCREYPLSSRYEELARYPHVGVMLAYGTDSCLQTQNFTLVFDPNEKPPTLIAAVYDQWEW